MFPYQPYQPYPQQFQPNYQTMVNQQPTLPQQQILQANGKASVDAIKLAPNSSVLVMDTTAPIVWLCVADGLGTTKATAYDITLHQDAPPVDMGSIEQRLANVENKLKEWGAKHESDARYAESKQTVRNDGSNSANQTGNGNGKNGK